MDTPHNIPVRSARDRIIDLLDIGDTYPLTDLNVVADQLKVVYGGTAKIPIENAQAGVTYQLCDPSGTPLGEAFQADGQGETLVIETPSVEEDVTYRIRATKKPSGSALPAQAALFLDERAPVKVGIDTSLVIRFKDEKDLTLLDPDDLNPQPSDPRIVVYGTSVDVQVEGTQEGVQYSLMLDGLDAKEGVTGDLGSVVLVTGPLREDTVIQVRATKKFFAAEKKADETKQLDASLFMKVMADPGLTVSVEAAPIIEYGEGATLMIANSQTGVNYRAYLCTIADTDFVRDIAGHDDVVADDDVVKILVDERPDVRVRKPARAERWYTPKGYVSVGDEPVPGTGGDIKISVNMLLEDTIVIVQALKEHLVDVNKSESTAIPSSICLNQAAAILVRPDPARALRLRVPVVGTQSGDTMQVCDGQPGIFYYFKPAPKGDEFSRPAYFHKRDDQDDRQNKGVEQLGVEIDFVITDEPDTIVVDPATTLPRPPVIDITSVVTDSKLLVRAVKAQTAVEATLTRDALIAAVPAIHAEQGVVDYAGKARIVIPVGNPQDEYQLMLQGSPVKPVVTGDNTDLIIETGPLIVDAVFEVVITRLMDQGLAVERLVQVSVRLRPDAGLPVSAKPAVVAKDTEADIVVQGSQPGVNYQLMSDKTAIGTVVQGTGADIALPSGPIAADMTFSIVAARMDDADIAVELQSQASVTLEPDA